MPPNVLLLIADSVRARNMSLYGHGNQTTPFLEEFASQSTVYTQARSPGAWSLPSHTSLFTGLKVPEHGLTSRQMKLAAGHTIWEELRDAEGYSTAVFSENPFVTTDAYGLARGFETVRTNLPQYEYPFDALNPEISESSSNFEYLATSLRDSRPVRSILNGGLLKIRRRHPWMVPSGLAPQRTNSARQYADAFLQWVANRETNWAACINFVDAHWPYRPRSRFDRWGGERARAIHDDIEHHTFEFYAGRKPWWQRRVLESLYDGSIRQIDDAIGHIMRELSQENVLDDTLVVITSDHGEGFGEPSRLNQDLKIAGHQTGCHEVLFHVPLIVKEPEQEVGERIGEVASLTQFPKVTRQLVRREGSEASFAPDRPVIASADYDSRYAKAAEDWPEKYRSNMDRSHFEGTVHMVYENNHGTVTKQATWGRAGVTVECASPLENMLRATAVSDRVVEEFEGYEKHNVATSGTESVSEEVSDRLHDLGYI